MYCNFGGVSCGFCGFSRKRRSTLAPALGLQRTFAAKASTQRNIECCIVWFVHTMVRAAGILYTL